MSFIVGNIQAIEWIEEEERKAKRKDALQNVREVKE